MLTWVVAVLWNKDVPSVPKTALARIKTDLISVFRYVKNSIFEDRLIVVAPGVAYYLMLGLMPSIAALILLYSLVSDPHQVQQQLELLRPAIPPDAAEMVSAQIERTAERGAAYSWGTAISIAVMVWASSYAMAVITAALNITFGTNETRGFIWLTVLRLILAAGGIALGLLAIGVMVVVPLILQILDFPEPLHSVLLMIRWPLLLLLGIFGLSILYQFAPDRPRPRFRLVSWGSTTAAVLWVIGSSVFSLYIGRVDAYNDFMGTFGAVIILMLWMLLTAFIILLGAEIDAAQERGAME